MGFKRIFGQEFSKPLLLDFLNNLLIGERKIENITFLDKEQPADTAVDRSVIYDILCETENGDRIIVEMQNSRQPSFKQRSVYYAANAIVRQGERGTQWRYDIKAVYLVAFLNFTLADIGKDFRTDVALMDVQKNTLFTDLLRLIYLQLPLFTKEADECENDFERWIYVLKNMETINRLPWMAKSAVFKRLSEVAEVSALSKEERIRYDHALKQYRDNINVYLGAIEEGREAGREEGREEGRAEGREEGRAEGREEGRAEGREEGRAEGRAEERREMARKLRATGMSIAQIAQVTSLSEEDINALE